MRYKPEGREEEKREAQRCVGDLTTKSKNQYSRGHWRKCFQTDAYVTRERTLHGPILLA